MSLKNKKFIRTVQIIFGLYLLFSGLVGYFVEFPESPYNEAGNVFLEAMFNTGYLFHLMSIIFILSGLMFISNKFSALGALLLTPITLNIGLFHLFLDFKNFWLALIPIILNIYLLAIHSPKYKSILSSK